MGDIERNTARGNAFSSDGSERNALGTLLNYCDKIPIAVEQGLEPQHFFAPHHEAIYAAMLDLQSCSEEITPQSVVARMRLQDTAGRLMAHGSESYLIDLQTDSHGPSGLADSVRAVRKGFLDRELARIRAELERSDLPPERRDALGTDLLDRQQERDAMLCDVGPWSGARSAPIPLNVDATLPPWPRNVFPAVIEAYVDAVTESFQVPRDMPAIIVLGVMATAWVGKAQVLDPRTGHAESLSLYLFPVAASGERKSSTVRVLSAPIFAYQRERVQELVQPLAEYQAEREGLEAEYQRALQDRKQTMDEEKRREAIERAAAAKRKIAELKPPPAASFIAQDATPEGLTRLMSETGGFAAIVDSEGGDIFENMIGRYGKDSAGPNIGVYLKGYDGEPVFSIRASKERQPEPIERASLSIVAATQPATIATLGKRSELRDRGLVARMLFGFCLESQVGSRSAFMPAPDAAVKRSYEDAITAALRIERLPTPYTVEISQEAQQELDRLHHEIEPRLAPGGDLAETPEWSQKLKGKIVRIAALLHLFDRINDRSPWETPVTGDAMKRAGRLLDYFIAHSRRAFGLMRQRPGYPMARKLLCGIQHKKSQRLTTAEASRLLSHSSVPNRDELRAALDVLEGHNYLRKIPSRRRDSEAWMVNPLEVRTWTTGQQGVA